MEMEDYYYHEEEDDFYDTKGNTYEFQKGAYKEFYTSSPDFWKKEIPSSSLLPSEPPTISQQGFGSSVCVCRVVTLLK